jgi:hypothetical protein
MIRPEMQFNLYTIFILYQLAYSSRKALERPDSVTFMVGQYSISGGDLLNFGPFQATVQIPQSS